MRKIRDSRFELLRIIAILMIILSHFSLFGQQYRLHTGILAIDFFGIRLFQPFGALGVYLFVLITGYFIGTKSISKTKAYKKILQIWFETLFYTFTIFVIFVVIKPDAFNLKNLVMAIFPFTFRAYWFVTAYIMLMLLAPFINIVVTNITKKNLIFLILAITVFGNILPALKNFVGGEANSLMSILPAYLIGAFIHKYGVRVHYSGRIGFLVFLFMCALGFGVTFIKGVEHGKGAYVGILPLIVAVSIFLAVVKMTEFRSQIINQLASTVFAAYLITENTLVRPVIWSVLRFSSVKNVWLSDIYGFISIIVITLVGVFVIDKTRQLILKLLHVDNLYNISILKNVNLKAASSGK